MKDFFVKVKDWFLGIIEFLKETRKELHNVSWPSRQEVTGTTVVVILTCFFFGFFLFVVDAIVNYGVNNLLFRALSAQS